MIELQQFAKKNKPNLHILSKPQEEMKRLAEERVSVHVAPPCPPSPHPQGRGGAPSYVTLAAVGGKLWLGTQPWLLMLGAVPEHPESSNPSR